MTAISAAARRLEEALRSTGKRRIRLREIRRAFMTAAPDSVAAPDQRERLASALADLDRHGRLHLPSTRASWDRSAHPPLPRSILLPGASGEELRHPAAAYPWRPELAFATSLRMDERSFDALRMVNAWLRDRQALHRVVPARERSLEIFGDEKAIDRLSTTRLFAAGRLTYDLLACEALSPPFVWREAGDGRVLLVVENHNTFHSLSRVLADRESPVSVVAYGAGRAFCRSVAYAADLVPAPTRVLYFGDLDLPGIRIPLRAGRVAARVGLPPIEPAAILYERLVEVGRAASWKRPAQPTEIEGLLAWLPASVRPATRELLLSGSRIAQEWLGLERLDADRTWASRL